MSDEIMPDPISIAISFGALALSALALRQSYRQARESNALAVRPVLVPEGIGVQTEGDVCVFLKSLRNNGCGPAMNVRLRMCLVRDGDIGEPGGDEVIISLAPGEERERIAQIWTELGILQSEERIKFALTIQLDYEDVLKGCYSARYDAHVDWGNDRPVHMHQINRSSQRSVRLRQRRLFSRKR